MTASMTYGVWKIQSPLPFNIVGDVCTTMMPSKSLLTEMPCKGVRQGEGVTGWIYNVITSGDTHACKRSRRGETGRGAMDKVHCRSHCDRVIFRHNPKASSPGPHRDVGKVNTLVQLHRFAVQNVKRLVGDHEIVLARLVAFAVKLGHVDGVLYSLVL